VGCPSNRVRAIHSPGERQEPLHIAVGMDSGVGASVGIGRAGEEQIDHATRETGQPRLRITVDHTFDSNRSKASRLLVGGMATPLGTSSTPTVARLYRRP